MNYNVNDGTNIFTENTIFNFSQLINCYQHYYNNIKNNFPDVYNNFIITNTKMNFMIFFDIIQLTIDCIKFDHHYIYNNNFTICDYTKWISLNNKLYNNFELDNSNKYDIFNNKINIIYNKIKEDNIKNIKTIIFTENSDNLNFIFKIAKEIGIKCNVLKGRGSVIKRNINELREGKLQTLLLNSKYNGSGLNLQFIQKIYIYGKVSKEDRIQIIGRVNRYNQKYNLEVITLS